jgi:hypothetical protein
MPLASSKTGITPSGAKRDRRPACPLHPETSYWLGDAKEMAAINTILIIVNNTPQYGLAAPKTPLRAAQLGRLFGKKAANLRLWPQRFINQSRDWLGPNAGAESMARADWACRHAASFGTDQLDAVAAARSR